MREVYAARRAKLMEGMKAPSIAVIYSGTAPMRSADEEYEFSVDRNFYYYTEIVSLNCMISRYPKITVIGVLIS